MCIKALDICYNIGLLYKYLFIVCQIVVRNDGSREESKVEGFFVFSHIRIKGYFWLG